MYQVKLVGEAETFFERCERPLAKKLAKCFGILERTPRRHPMITALRGKYRGWYRYRLGDYRVLYTIQDNSQSVFVGIIAKRDEAYR